MDTRQEFMDFFRDDEKLALLSADDRVELFSQALISSDDFTFKLLDEIFSDYSVSHLSVVPVESTQILIRKIVKVWQSDGVDFGSGTKMMAAMLKVLGYNPDNAYDVNDMDIKDLSGEDITSILTKPRLILVNVVAADEENPLVKCPRCGNESGLMVDFSYLKAGFNGIKVDSEDDVDLYECGGCLGRFDFDLHHALSHKPYVSFPSPANMIDIGKHFDAGGRLAVEPTDCEDNCCVMYDNMREFNGAYLWAACAFDQDDFGRMHLVPDLGKQEY